MPRKSKRNGPSPSKGKSKGKSSYDALKEFDGKRYSGMKVGRGHKWRYDAGEWSEKKVTPDKWEFSYSVVKRRKGKAPEGSGAPVGTSHHWYILADQVVTKLDANSYTTEMSGVKYKLAHRRASAASWSAGERGRRNHLVRILQKMIAELEKPLDEERAAPPADELAAARATKGPQRRGRPTAASRAPSRSRSSSRTKAAPRKSAAAPRKRSGRA